MEIYIHIYNFLTVFTKRSRWSRCCASLGRVFSGFGLESRRGGKTQVFLLLKRGMPKVKRRVTTTSPVKTKCPINATAATTKKQETAVPFSTRDPARGVSALPSHRRRLASSLETRRGKSPTPREQGAAGMSDVRLKGVEVSAFLNGRPIGVGRELWQAGLLGSGVMGEDRVLAGGAGGAAGVRVARGILIQGDRQLEILLKAKANVRRPNADVSTTSCDEETRTNLVGRHGQTAIQILHQLLERGSLRGHGVPAVPHHHVPAQKARHSQDYCF